MGRSELTVHRELISQNKARINPVSDSSFTDRSKIPLLPWSLRELRLCAGKQKLATGEIWLRPVIAMIIMIMTLLNPVIIPLQAALLRSRLRGERFSWIPTFAYGFPLRGLAHGKVGSLSQRHPGIIVCTLYPHRYLKWLRCISGSEE